MGRVLLAFCLFWFVAPIQAVTLYQIGNQVTLGTLRSGAMADESGLTLELGKHLFNNRSLQRIWDTPTETTSSTLPFGNFSEALPNNDWDFVSLQSFPYYGATIATLGDDVNAANSFIDLTESAGRNAETVYFVLTSWPNQTSWGEWESWVPDELSEKLVARRYYDHLLDRLRSEHGVDKVSMIPTADTLFEVKQAIEKGQIPGISNLDELYYQPTVLNSLGDFVAATTVLATVMRHDPRGMPVPSEFSTVPPDFAAAIQEVVWDTVNFHPYSGVTIPDPGDFDVDGDADNQDYQVWSSSFGSANASADGNQNGIVDAADYTTWQDGFTGRTSPVQMYQVGNSLTQSSNRAAISAIAAKAGIDLETGWHIKSASSLTNIRDNPTILSSEAGYFGPFSYALPGQELDHVTLQAYPAGSTGNTLDDDINAIGDFMDLTRSNPANSDTVFYIYTSWPWHWNWDGWETPFEDDLDNIAIRNGEYYEVLMGRLHDIHGPENISMVPAAETLFRLNQEIELGTVPGLTHIRDVYSDHVHLNTIGQFIMATAVFSTIFQIDPRGLEIPTEFWDEAELSPELAAVLQNIVWEVVSTNSYAGIVDLATGAAASVPEPSSLLLFISFSSTLICRNRRSLASVTLPGRQLSHSSARHF